MVLLCHLAWKRFILSKKKKKKNYKERWQENRKKFKKKSWEKFTDWGFVRGESVWGRCMFQCVERKGKKSFAGWLRHESVRQKLNKTIIHPWAAFHRSALPWNTHTHKETQRGSEKQTHPSRVVGINTSSSQCSGVHSVLIQILWQAETLKTRFAPFITWNTFTSAASGEALS